MRLQTAQGWRRVMVAIFFTFFHFYAGAQAIENTLAVYAHTYAHERVYLHYDKSAYAAGETVWFKAYLMEDILPAQGSKTLYIDWVDEKGAVLLHAVSPVIDGVTSGQFDIPPDYGGDFIHVRAYTRWMLNFDSSFLYNKDIRVVGKTPRSMQKAVAAEPSLHFFAEGGDAIAGIQNKIAFKAEDQWGSPVPATGVVQNSNGTAVASFKTLHDGMGFFYLAPEPGMQYTATWKDAKGIEHTMPLPAVKSSGVTLELAVDSLKRRFTLTRTGGAPQLFKQLHLVGTMNQNLIFKTTVDLTAKTTASGVIPTEALPTGILTITVFDAAWNAVAERITFVRNKDYRFEPELIEAYWGFNKRARNEVQLTVPDSIVASLSVSVTDNALAVDSSDNIITRLLLTGELKGTVSHPEYYFKHDNALVNQQLDLVMLTHGWRRFKWEDVVNGKLPAISHPKDTAYLTLSGKLYGMPRGSISGGTINMILKGKDASVKMMTEPIRADGSFNNPQAYFFDTLQVYYQLQPAKLFNGASVRFMEGRLQAPDYKPAAQTFKGVTPADTAGRRRLQLLVQERAIADSLMKQKTLENVTVRARIKTPLQVMDEKYAFGMFRGGDSYQFDLVNDPRSGSYSDIFMYLQGKVAGLQINGAGSNVSLQWRGGPPAVFLNEMATDVNMLSSIPVSDIAYVKVFRPPFLGGHNGSNGGIAIYTRKGNDAPVTSGKGLNNNAIAGYTPVKQFYTPNYAITNPRNEQRDVRTTLYWNPTVLTSPENRTVTLTFYNNDVTKSYRVVIEGMAADGRLAHVEQVIE
jgi:hypothetical protein